MVDYVIGGCCIVFFIASIAALGSFTGRFCPYRCKRDIAKAKEKYTVPIVAKCFLVEEREVLRYAGEYTSYDPGDPGDRGHTSHYSKSIKVNQPTYQANYAGHSRCFFKRDLDYKPYAYEGEYYTIYLNPEDEKYRDFVDEFFYLDRENMIRKYLILRYVALLLMAVSAIIFLVLVSNYA